MTPVTVIGGGMAGVEAATMLARLGIPVRLYEMRPKKTTAAHQLSTMGELVCSNSFGAMAPNTAPGLLKYEMLQLKSIILQAAEQTKVPAGKALAVDRVLFSEWIDEYIHGEDNIEVVRDECENIPEDGFVIVASGPLTSDALAEDLTQRIGQGSLYFYDSISPIVASDSIDYSKVFFGSRYQENQDDYLNCPMDRTLYEAFVEAIVASEKVPVKAFEALKCFESCLPVEVLAERGLQTLAFGPMKPVGLIDPKTGKRPYAVIQLRRENSPTTMYNLVGFQSRMKWGDQKKVFQMIPGLENAEFVRFGSMHRNTYIDSPKSLNPDMSLKVDPRIHIAGQITGVEGYVESAAMGQWAALSIAAKVFNHPEFRTPPRASAFGSLIEGITQGPLHGQFSPININFGLLPPLENKGGGRQSKDDRRKAMLAHANVAFGEWVKYVNQTFNCRFGLFNEVLPYAG